MASIPILYEDNHLLVVNKPTGVVSQGAREDDVSVIREMAAMIKARDNKPGNVYLGIVSRLDKLTTGVLPIAKTSKAAARLSEQIRNRKTRKRYLAVVEGRVENKSNTLVDTIANTIDSRRVRIVDQLNLPAETDKRKLQRAELRYERLATKDNYSLLEIQLITGRKHQIRLQMANVGHPIIGDKRYCAQPLSLPDSEGDVIGLHCYEIQFQHPTKQTQVKITAPPPDYWHRWFSNYSKLISSRVKTAIGGNVYLSKIVSGGQTGVDRAALDVAIELGIPHGGWCPKGRLAEDGPIDSKYQLDEMSSKDYTVRTRQNVIDSDGTLVIFESILQGGTRLTKKFADEKGKPCYCISLLEPPSIEEVLEWLATHEIQKLNVAGPRGSHSQTIYSSAGSFLRSLFQKVQNR